MKTKVFKYLIEQPNAYIEHICCNLFNWEVIPRHKFSDSQKEQIETIRKTVEAYPFIQIVGKGYMDPTYTIKKSYL